MENQELVAHAIIGFGALLALFGIWKLIQKGFLFWVMLVVIGLSAVGVGLYSKKNGSVEQLLKEINPGTISRMTTDNLEKLCNNLDKLPKIGN